jgi:beta-galactosidase GanA
MDEGWTRWTLEEYGYRIKKDCETIYKSTTNEDIVKGNFKDAKFIIFPDQSPNAMLNGHAKGTMPDEYTGGIGKDGVDNLKKFVEDGGTLVFLNRASIFAIEQFNLPIKNVTQGLNRKEFYIPGSILRTELDTNHKIAKGMEKESIAWFENSPAFEITDKTTVEIIAKYPDNSKDILLSGWALGQEKLAGKAALVQINIGKGKIILFGFRPQYRGQSLATFPLLFNAISQ